jgi:type IV pilus assembly protein PilX
MQRANRQTFPNRQHGVALVIALVLLLVVTVLGLASMRDMTLQERISANMYDRSLAFQRSEAALRAAEAAITSNWQIATLGGQDCTGANACVNVGTTAFTAGGANWTNVPTGTTGFEVNNSNTVGTPQYHIQFIDTGSSPNAMGLASNADAGNYGNTYPPDNVAHYRVTARSSDPADSTDRSIVVLQSTVKRAY